MLNGIAATQCARKPALGVLALLICALPVGAQTMLAQSTVTDPPTVVMVRATAALAEHAPIIDGRDDDAAWVSATAITGFRVFDPKEDGDPTFPTAVKISYDA